MSMIKTISGCVDCGRPCMGHACPNYEVEVYACDDCESTEKDLYDIDGDLYCSECVLSYLPKVCN